MPGNQRAQRHDPLPLDPAATPLSVQRCRERLGADGNDLSDERSERFVIKTDTLAHVLIDIYLWVRRISISHARNGLVRSLLMNPVRSRLVKSGSRLKSTP
jgi:hypothetical protein